MKTWCFQISKVLTVYVHDFLSLSGLIQQISTKPDGFFSSLDVLPVAFDAVFILSRLRFHGQSIGATHCCLTVPPYCLFAVLLIVTLILLANDV